MRRIPSSLFFTFSMKSRGSMFSAWIWSSMSITAALAPPWAGPERAPMPAEIEVNRFA